jgi:hypothetical protein
MGFSSYFKTSINVPAEKSGVDNEKLAVNKITDNQNFPEALQGRLAVADSEVNSISPAPSTRAEQEDRLVDEIKHQVVLNHLYQHQCSSLWVRDVTQQTEGVLVRKRRNEYLFKPPGLASSSFAQAMMMLNVQVSSYFLL